MGVVRIHRLSPGIGVALGSGGCEFEDDLDVWTMTAGPVAVVVFVEMIQHIHKGVRTSLRNGPVVAGTVELHRYGEHPIHRLGARLIE